MYLITDILSIFIKNSDFFNKIILFVKQINFVILLHIDNE